MAGAELKQFIQDAPVPAAMFDREMRYMAASRNWVADYRLEEPIIGRTIYEVSPDIPERWKRVHQRALSGETLSEAEDRFERANGHLDWVRWEARPWRTETGDIGGITIFAENITTKKQAEEERELLASLVASSGDFIGICDAQFNPFFANPAALSMVGLASLEEAKRTPVSEFFFPEDRSHIMNEFFPRVLQDGFGDVEVRFRHFKTGEPIWMHYSVFAILDKATGQPRGYATVSKNITEQRFRHQELLEAQQRLHAVMHAAPVGLSYSDSANCDHITGNPALYQQFDMDPGANISASASDPATPGRKIHFCQDGREVPPNELPLQRAVREKHDIGPIELEVELPTGRRWYAEASAAPIFGENGEVIGGVAVTVDITERLRAKEALERADRRKDEFIATLSHELRNPLAAIANAIAILMNSEGGRSSEEADRRALRIAERQTRQLKRLIDDLMDVSRVSHGKIELVKQRIDIRAIVKDAAFLSKEQIDARHHRLCIDMPDGPLVVEADAARLVQVFSNLLDNAAKYTPMNGSIGVTVAKDGSDVVVKVRDNGVGILQKDLPHIFEVFFQATTSPGQLPTGLGLGLPLVRQLVELQGGSVAVASEGPGRGSEFVVRMPMAQEATVDLGR